MKKQHRKLADRENKVIKNMGARKTVNSGATRQDGDGRRVLLCKVGFREYNGILLEVKSTDAKSFSVKADTMEKARRQALQNDDMPVLVVDMNVDKFVVLRYDDFLDLVDDYERKEETIRNYQ